MRRLEGKAALQDALRWPVSADRRDDSVRLGDDADARAQVSALVTTPTVVCISMGFAGAANEVVRRISISIVPTVREHITSNGFVGLADALQPSNGHPFLLAGHQCIGSPHSGQVAGLMPHLLYAKSSGDSVREVRQEPVFLC